MNDNDSLSVIKDSPSARLDRTPFRNVNHLTARVQNNKYNVQGGFQSRLAIVSSRCAHVLSEILRRYLLTPAIGKDGDH